MQAVVAEKGQVTIPYRLRLKLGITPKTVLNFSSAPLGGLPFLASLPARCASLFRPLASGL